MKELNDQLSLIGHETINVTVYAFVCSLLLEEESSERHLMASELLATALCPIEGAYHAGFYHARRAIELSPEDINLKEHLLYFSHIPDELLPREEAIEVANRILAVKPDSQIALWTLRLFDDPK